MCGKHLSKERNSAIGMCEIKKNNIYIYVHRYCRGGVDGGVKVEEEVEVDVEVEVVLVLEEVEVDVEEEVEEEEVEVEVEVLVG
jgi:hypothetical protein